MTTPRKAYGSRLRSCRVERMKPRVGRRRMMLSSKRMFLVQYGVARHSVAHLRIYNMYNSSFSRLESYFFVEAQIKTMSLSVVPCRQQIPHYPDATPAC
jgi:hypothetical protein